MNLLLALIIATPFVVGTLFALVLGWAAKCGDRHQARVIQEKRDEQ